MPGISVRRLSLLLGTLAVVLIALSSPTVLAHPLDEFPQISYITVHPGSIVVEVKVTPGVLLAPETLETIDANGDETVSDAEARAYVQTILDDLLLAVDGSPLPLTLTSYEVPPYLNIQAGYGLMRIAAIATLPEHIATDGATHTITYANAFAPPNPTYQVNAFVDRGENVSLGEQQRSDDQRSLTVTFSVGGVVGEAPPVPTAGVGTGSSRVDRLLAVFDEPSLSPPAILLAIGLAILLGGLHALTPGHGKTLVAAYLVGSRGTMKHAVALGATVTFTHTISVIAIGLLALFASQLIVPDVLVPTIQVISGLLVVVLGARLLWQRWSARRGVPGSLPLASHTHAYAGGFVHHHGDGRVHSHLPPPALDRKNIVALGISGGLVPCPEALGIMIIAVGLDHIVLGLGLIVAFSVGLAAVLIGIGIALVRSRRLLDKFGQRGGFVQSWLPLFSAAVVIALGLGITWKGVEAFDSLSNQAITTLLIGGVGGACLLVGFGAAWAVMSRSPSAATPSSTGMPRSMLPPRYQDGHAVSAAPMSAAPLVFDDRGDVAWDRIWGHDDADQPFCDLAIAGGPPHRGTLLVPDLSATTADPAGLATVRTELARGLRMVTPLEIDTSVPPGWIGLRCPNELMADWLTLAISAENVACHRLGLTILLPADPTFRTDEEVRNVVTAVAKTWHYWSEHAAAIR